MANSEFNPQLDKVTEKELNLVLRERIAIAYNHISNNSKHITNDERKSWNGKWDKDNAPLASKFANGIMSKEDKLKLDSVSERANFYTHPASGVEEGVYLLTTVDRNGHVINGSYPKELNITVSNSKLLDGVEASKFAQKTSPTFLGEPTCPTAPDGDSSFLLANTQFVSLNSIGKVYEASNTPPSDKRILWLDTTRSSGAIACYWNGSEWSDSIFSNLEKTGVKAGAYGPSENVSSGSFGVPFLRVDDKGRVTEAKTSTVTLPSVLGQSVKVTASTQTARWAAGSSGGGYDTTTGSGNITSYSYRTIAGISAGTYSLQNLLQNLVTMSHRHQTVRTLYNCNCNCDCDCGDDSCIISGSVKTPNGYTNIEHLRPGDLIECDGEIDMIFDIVKGKIQNRKAIKFVKENCVFTEEHLFLFLLNIPSVYNKELYHKTKNKIIKSGNFEAMYPVLEDKDIDYIDLNDSVKLIDMPSDTTTYTIITNKLKFCDVNGIITACATLI